MTKEYIKLTKQELIDLEKLLIQATPGKNPTTEALIKYLDEHKIRNSFLRCPKCKNTNGFYPHVLHMKEKHGITINKTLKSCLLLV